MKVRELIDILKRCDPEMEVATHATNHTQIDEGSARVVLMSTYAGPRVAIGDFSKRMVNKPNWFVVREIDGGGRIPDEWPGYSSSRSPAKRADERNRILRERGHEHLAEVSLQAAPPSGSSAPEPENKAHRRKPT